MTKHFAIIGAGIAGITCARTLLQAGHQVTVFEKSRGVGGRMSTRSTPFGSFDHGTQYFTVRDARFAQAIETAPGVCKPWSANAVRVLDAMGRVVEAALPHRESHWVAKPGMNALVKAWAQPLEGQIQLGAKVLRIARDALNKKHWQLHTEGEDESGNKTNHVFAGFDGVLLAQPPLQAQELLRTSNLAPAMVKPLNAVQVAPCWTLMVAFPNAAQSITLGPQWNAARSNHHRVAWLARESSKPGRNQLERWTIQASAAWSQEHLEDAPERVQAKLLKAFSEITGIRATPAHADVHRWRYAKTLHPLGKTHLWDAKQGLGICGDWCIGHRAEDGFVSGLELSLAVAHSA
jgi:predicted NAD/FAD-dependent oxidoreductase